MYEGDEFWCSTCGITIHEDEYAAHDGECFECFTWWLNDNPDNDGEVNDY